MLINHQEGVKKEAVAPIFMTLKPRICPIFQGHTGLLANYSRIVAGRHHEPINATECKQVPHKATQSGAKRLKRRRSHKVRGCVLWSDPQSSDVCPIIGLQSLLVEPLYFRIKKFSFIPTPKGRCILRFEIRRTQCLLIQGLSVE